MNKKGLITGILVVVCVLIIILLFLKPTADSSTPITYYAGKNTQAILFINDNKIFTVEKFNIVALDRQNPNTPKTLVENIKSYNSSQDQDKVFSTVFGQNSLINGNVTNFSDEKTSQLKDVTGIIWFSSPLYARLSKNIGFSKTEVVTSSGQVVLSGQPYDDLSGFADRYITYSLGEGGNPKKTEIYDIKSKSVVKEINLSGQDPTPRDYKNFLVYQTSNSTKALDSDLAEIDLTGIKKLSHLSDNVVGNSIYGLEMQKDGNGTRVKLKKFNMESKQSEVIKNFLLSNSSPLRYDTELQSMWFEETSGQLFLVINNQIYLIGLKA